MDGVRGMALPARVHARKAPATTTAASGQRACAAKALPELRWHSRQWHTDTRSGSPAHTARSCPQAQEATRTSWGRGGLRPRPPRAGGWSAARCASHSARPG
jgi:hypothetical protein